NVISDNGISLCKYAIALDDRKRIREHRTIVRLEARVLLVPEEEKLLFILIELSVDVNGSPQRISADTVAVWQSLCARSVIEEVVGVQGFIAIEVIGRAVQRLGTGFRDHRNGPAAVASVLSLIVAGEDLDFSHRVHVGHEGHATVRM